ncbi:MAG TPA: thiamine-phosphate kinase [Terriglobales bacterium]|nr:thiamine-phosphate kinase [Terriglobales bacterium]
MPLSEKLLIQRIRRAAARGAHSGHGIGDDCAVLPIPRGHEALVTTDLNLEDVHFRREWHPPDSVGHRCLTRGLSDIAAMGGIPRAAFLSLALPADLPQEWVDRFIAGLVKLATRFSVQLAGGDTAQSPDGVLADIMVLASVPAGRAILRSGARPGDSIYVTGTLGSAAAVLNLLRDGKKLRPGSHPKHFYPEPRLAVGRYLRENEIASSMIDVSDGLSTDLGHLCEESKTGAVVYAESLPTIAGLTLALHGGDEYELLFTAHPNRRIPKLVAGVPVTRIGEITRGRQMKLVTAAGKREILKPAGWEHFARNGEVKRSDPSASTFVTMLGERLNAKLALFRRGRCL